MGKYKFDIVIVVACARQGAIGLNNTMPWRLPEDLAHFKALTSGHSIIMGRKTFESIGKPLPNRRSIVITSNQAWHAPSVETAPSLEAALALSQQPSSSASAMNPVFIVGGAQIYRQALPLADRVELTDIDLDVPGADAFFPTLPTQDWVDKAGVATWQTSLKSPTPNLRFRMRQLVRPVSLTI